MYDLTTLEAVPTTDWTTVESSNIAALKHDGSRMFVKFLNGTVYTYENVALETYHEIVTAASVGRTFNQLVKSQPTVYPYKKV